jgi:predicted NBD/HSP70 family sugar kinase
LLVGVRELGAVSRPELARYLGLSTVTVASIAQELVAAGVLAETGTRGQRVGRKAVVLDVAPEAGAAFVADVRADDVRWRRVGLRGDVQDAGTMVLPDDPEALADRLAAVALGAHGRVRSTPLEAVVAVPATVQDDGTVRYWGTPGMLHGARLGAMLEARLARRQLDAAVALYNDVNLAAVGEHRLGVARDWSRFVFIGVRTTGVGMGLVLDGRLYRGATGRAGEIGNLRLSDDGTPLDARFTRLAPAALAELAKVLAVTFAVLDLDGVVVHSEVERGFDWFGDLDRQLRALVPFPIALRSSELQDDAVLEGAALVALDALWPHLATRPA